MSAGTFVFSLIAWSVGCGLGAARPPAERFEGTQASAIQASQPAEAIASKTPETIVWTQGAANLAELRRLEFWLVVDGAQSILQKATCTEQHAPATSFECKAPLPVFADGRHEVRVASAFRGTSARESSDARSLPLIVYTEAGRTASTSADPRPSMPPPTSLRRARQPRPSGPSPIQSWATGLDDPRLLSPASRDRLFFATGSSQLYSATSAGAAPVTVSTKTPGGTRILAIAPHPRFETTHQVYVAWSVPAGGDRTDVQVRRYVWNRNALTDEVNLVHVRAARADAAVLMAFGPDGKLYLVLPSSPHSMIYRFNEDGAVPAEHTSRTAMFALGPPQASAFAWNPRTSDLWCVGSSPDGAQLLVFSPPDKGAFGRLPLNGHPPPGTQTARRRQAQRVSSLAFISSPDAATADLLAVVPDNGGEVVRLSVGDGGAIRIAGRYPSGPEGRITEVAAANGDVFLALQTPGQGGTIGAVPGGGLRR